MSATKATLRVAAIQMTSGMDPRANAEAAADLIRAAAREGARYVQTPEMTGALIRDQARLRTLLKSETDDPVLAVLRPLAAQLGLHLHIGSLAIRAADGSTVNRGFLIAPDGTIRARYDKIHMFDVDLPTGESWRESASYQPGTRAVIAALDLDGGKTALLGMAICYDLRFAALFRAEALAGAELLCVPAAFTRPTGEAHWHVLLRARAIENGAFVIAAAQGGLHEDGRETYGHSLIVDPWGRILAEKPDQAPGMILADLELGAVADARARIPVLKNGRDFDVVRLGS